MLAFIAFVATVPIANWLIGNVGFICVPNGPCLLPVGFGLLAPSGVLVVGVAFVLRDVVHKRLGVEMAFAAILAGAALSLVVAPASLALASTAAFVISETVDLAVAAPLIKRRFWLAVILSSVAGLVIDSVAFLWLAFGSLDFLAAQIVGKLWAVGLAALALRLYEMRLTATKA
jgi:uncharacterized PurR-regulated membrane protein YhhQ (DUF165 family)